MTREKSSVSGIEGCSREWEENLHDGKNALICRRYLDHQQR